MKEKMMKEMEAIKKQEQIIEAKSNVIMKVDDELTEAYQTGGPTKAIINRKNKMKKEIAELVWDLNESTRKFNEKYRHENCSK